MRVAVAGAAGQLGAAIVHQFSRRHEVVAFDRAALDVTDDLAVQSAMARVVPDVIVNCAAYNEVDEAEDHPVDALRVNAFAVRTLARAAAAHGSALVHYSTDFVFDGAASEPYLETDAPNPRSVYGTSKLLGEWFAAGVPRSYVLRVESLFGQAPGGPQPKGSVAAIVDALVNGRPPRVFSDRTVSPTCIVDAAAATVALIEGDAPPGLYHCVNSGRCTWLELARAVAGWLGVEPVFDVVRMDEVALKAPRPRYCALSNAKLASVGIVMRPWEDALARYLQDVRRDVAHQLPDRQR